MPGGAGRSTRAEPWPFVDGATLSAEPAIEPPLSGESMFDLLLASSAPEPAEPADPVVLSDSSLSVRSTGPDAASFLGRLGFCPGRGANDCRDAIAACFFSSSSASIHW